MRRRFAAVSGWADGSGSGNGLPGASGRACLLLESGALVYSAGAVSSRLPAATCGQAARSYSWTMPPWTSLRVIEPLPRRGVAVLLLPIEIPIANPDQPQLAAVRQDSPALHLFADVMRVRDDPHRLHIHRRGEVVAHFIRALAGRNVDLVRA